MFAKKATWFLRTQVIDKQIKVNFDRIRPAIDGLKIGRWFQTKSNSLVVGSFLFRWHLIATRRQCADRLFFCRFLCKLSEKLRVGTVVSTRLANGFFLAPSFHSFVVFFPSVCRSLMRFQRRNRWRVRNTFETTLEQQRKPGKNPVTAFGRCP